MDRSPTSTRPDPAGRAHRLACSALRAVAHRHRVAALASGAVLLAATPAVFLLPAAPAAAAATTTISMSGSTASFPLLGLLSQAYTKLHPSVKFRIAQGGTTVGISDAAAGNVTLGDVSRDRLSTDPSSLTWYPIARYYVCMITNKANPLPNLTEAQAQQIFTGKVRSWSQVSGATATGTIDLISRTSTAGVLSTFQTLLLGGSKVSSLAAQESSEGLVQQQVKSDPNAIGFVSGYFATGVNPVGYGGVGCNLANATAGEYPGVATFYEVSKGPATGAAASFLFWVVHSAAAKKIVSTEWLELTAAQV